MAGLVIKVNDETPTNAFEEKRDKLASEAFEEEHQETVEEDTKTNEESTEAVEEQVETVSESETQAREKGWKPKEEFEGDPEEWVPAEEFVARGPLYETIHKLKRTIKRMQETLDASADQYNKMEKRVREETIADLQKQLKEASDNQDVAKALEVKEKIDEVKKADAPDKPPVNPVFEEWIEDNQWYNNDEILRVTADGLGARLLQKNPKMPAAELYAEVAKQIKKEFPHKFNKTETKVSATTVTPTKRTVASPTKKKSNLPNYKQLPADARVNYRRLVKSTQNPRGIITHEQFMKDYVANNGPVETEE